MGDQASADSPARARPPGAATPKGSAPVREPAPPGEAASLSFYTRAIRAHRAVVALVTIATLVGAFAWSATRPSSYEAASELSVAPLSSEGRGLLTLPLIRSLGDPTRTIQTAAALVETGQIAAVAADRLGEPWTAQAVLDATEVIPIGQSNILQVRAEADDAETAAELANAYADAVLQVRNALLKEAVDAEVATIEARLQALQEQGSTSLDVLLERLLDLQSLDTDPTIALAQSALPPDEPNRVSPVILFAAALLAGLVLGVLAALLLDAIGKPRVVDEGDLQSIYPLPVLARIPAHHRRHPEGGDGTHPADDAFRELSVLVQLTLTAPHTLLITSAGRGDGRTATVAGLAHELARLGGSVLAVDLDVESPSLASTLASTPNPPLASVGTRTILEAPVQLLDRSLSILDIGATDGPSPLPTPSALAHALDDVKAEFDYTIIDGPPITDTPELLHVARRVDSVLLLVRLRHTTRESLRTARRLLEDADCAPAGVVVIGSRATSR